MAHWTRDNEESNDLDGIPPVYDGECGYPDGMNSLCNASGSKEEKKEAQVKTGISVEKGGKMNGLTEGRDTSKRGT